ncbi:MAG TPA: aminotransferase class V-fold PLP-dependent enzyme, partial [Anaerolineaceae bacterium]|nr:aminotransferase class V-fold PLP-dependent enzyme [Anaerolineaceae bacterium]
AHKMYAPFGTGALIGRRDLFEQGAPDLRGGGEVEIVTVDDVVWSEPPERDEAGSPNTVGAVALGAAIAQLEAIGMQAVANHEAELTRYALEQFAQVPNLRMFGCPDPEKTANRLGVIPVVMEGMSHYLVAAILGYEYGIGVRNGCFCAHPYLLNLLGVSEDRAGWVRSSILSHDRREVPGLVRISFGLYNEKEDVDVLVNALLDIQKGKYKGKYSQDVRSGAFQPEGWDIRFEDYFRFSVSQ